jgi:type I restriction enzyme, R subunit
METYEQKARENIDKQLEQSGWTIQDYTQANLTVSLGVAVREYPIDTGEADYMLFIEGQPVGVIEAKKEGTILTEVHDQTVRYATGIVKWFINKKPIPFLYEASGIETHFADYRDPKPRSRDIFHFHRPETLRDWIRNGDTLRKSLQQIPQLELNTLWDCQFNAISNLEKSLTEAKPRALIWMATGAGKTFTVVNSIYRLLKFAKAKRVLFLVDTRNLGEQAQQEFQKFTPPDDNRKFTELYNVQRLNSGFIDKNSQVCISTIQRMYSILSGNELDESLEQNSPYEINLKDEQPRLVNYNPNVPVEFFDFIFIDECHRSIYNLWRQVLEYFDGFLVGMTATPEARTFAFFNENVVSEYSHEQSVADGVNVGYEVYEIETEITKKGATILKDFVETRSKLDRKRRWTQLEDDFVYKNTQLDRDVVNMSQIRRVIRTFREKINTEIFPNRQEVPKTLIFAKTDSHADDIIRTILEEFGEENKFCRKITYNADNPSTLLQSFRNEYYPRIAVTVDMIATGTDVKPIECLLFMRDVKSRSYFEQMKGRGTRRIDIDDLRRVTPSAASNKSHFMIIDAVGVCRSIKTESRQLERKKSVPLESLMMGAAMGQRDEDTVLSLANRLTKLEKQLDVTERNRITELTDGVSINQIVRNLIDSYDPDVNPEIIIDDEQSTMTDEEKNNYQMSTASCELVREACKPFNDPEFRDYIENCRRTHEQIIDNVNIDKLILAGFSEQAKEEAQKTVDIFKRFLIEKMDEITALRIFYSQPYQRRHLTYKMIKELNEILMRQPYSLTTEKLWYAYERLDGDKVKGTGTKRMLTDIISLLRYELRNDDELSPFSDIVNRNFKKWIFNKNSGNIQFTEEQTEWLRMIKDHIAASVNIENDDFDNTPFAEHGGLQKVWMLFHSELTTIIEELNIELAG